MDRRYKFSKPINIIRTQKRLEELVRTYLGFKTNKRATPTEYYIGVEITRVIEGKEAVEEKEAVLTFCVKEGCRLHAETEDELGKIHQSILDRLILNR